MKDLALPVELTAALAADPGAQAAWDQTPYDIRWVYVGWVSKPRSRRLRRALAADTASWAKSGPLTERIQKPSGLDAAVALGDGCLIALLRLGL